MPVKLSNKSAHHPSAMYVHEDETEGSDDQANLNLIRFKNTGGTLGTEEKPQEDTVGAETFI